MEVEDHICQRKQHRIGVVGDHFGHLAVALSGKHSIQVRPVDWGGARASEESREIERRNHDHATADGHRGQALQEFHQGDRPLELVAVVATGQ